MHRVTARILHGITNNSLRVDCFRNQYHQVLLGGRTILHDITNNSFRVDCFRNQYHRVLLGGLIALPMLIAPEQVCRLSAR